MAKIKKTNAIPNAKKNRVATSPELRDGTASSQVISHFLKLASTKEKLEREILEKQKDLITAKTENLHSAQRIEELYENAMNALKGYSGRDDSDD